MPLFMDVHNLDGGVSADRRRQRPPGRPADPGQARRELRPLLGRRGAGQDLLPRRGAPAEAADTVHREAHGLVADAISTSPRRERSRVERRSRPGRPRPARSW